MTAPFVHLCYICSTCKRLWLFLLFPGDNSSPVHARYPHNTGTGVQRGNRGFMSVCLHVHKRSSREKKNGQGLCSAQKPLYIPQMCVHVCVHVCLFSLDKVRYPSLNAPPCLLHYPLGSTLLPHSPLSFKPLTFPFLLPPSFTYVFLPFLGGGGGGGL